MSEKNAEPKHYEVLVTGFATVLVINAENESSAFDYARDELHGDFEIDEMKIESVIDPSDERATENARRHATVVADE